MVEVRLTVARRALEELMGIPGYRYQMPHARQQFAEGKKEGLEQGRKEGHARALEQGRREALVSVLTDQLEYRFGELPAYAVRAIAAADIAALRELGARVLTAASLDDLLPRPARPRARATVAGPRSRKLIEECRLQTVHAREQFAAGEEKGRSEGIQEGIERGHWQALTSLLEQRFGPLPVYAIRALAAADIDTLRSLSARVLTARSLDDLVPRPARRRAPATAAGTRPRSRAGTKAETPSRTRSRGR
jgi:flagellar biosynthesis/type III secretory pathway protein FliH